ncbi:MAG TPA: hypothetical protein VFP65_23170 [Anaeromyxobacteraceae bacterium]|nr:hypothetical protein [Anaeromyxobacteraceae bacterium]
MRFLAPPLALAAALALPARAADVFSPGDLSRAHAHLGGLENCTRCHPRGEQLSQARCLECHKELAPRVAGGRGFHGRIAEKDRACWACHHEHQGRDFAAVDWGAGGPRRFDHAKTGTSLAGKHAGVACERCHDPRLVADPGVKALLAEQPRRRTYLGAPAMADCARCHLDEHRGQLGPDCQRCHGESAWKPAKGFDHARTAYPLTGKHAAVACEKCHARVEDAARPDPGALTPAVHADFHVRYRPVAHALCLDCHRDPHEKRFGDACARCHTTDDWRRIASQGAEQRAFHERTRYPLAGAHATVACVACHGPWPGQPAVFKPLAFQACADCHADAHAGQLARGGQEGARCDRCHALQGFQPVRFGVEEHDRTRYPLQGAHRAVSCAACHPHEPRVADGFPAAAREELRRRGRPVKLSLSLYALAGDLRRCETCHADPHGGQLRREAGCAACHELTSFRKVRFDHGDSRFALTGAHARASCTACHGPDPAVGGAVRYRPLPLDCAGCHADPHAAQLAGGCDRCHGTDDWKRTLFKHERPFTEYALAGRHAKVACEKCHAAVQVAGGAVRKYRPLPRACEACHADFHRGRMRPFEPVVRASSSPTPTTSSVRLERGAKRGVEGRNKPDLVPALAHAGGDTACVKCHTVDAWSDVAFAHERTGFPLRGAHARLSCKDCHGASVERALGRSCSSCHRDVHQGRLSSRCAECHGEESWKARFDADAHRRGNFPLTGRHAFIPCQECHGDRRDRGFTRATSECIACHQNDLARAATAAVDHRAPGFPTRCQTCHSPWRFRPAFFPAHEACFPIGSGPHAGVACLSCHTALSGLQATGTCATGTAACTRCHACASHPQDVPGFACAERKCYECHRSGTPVGLRSLQLKRRSP